MEALAPFDPRLVGTPPLGIAIPDSDLDIVCEAPDADAFARALTDAFGALPGFILHRRADLGAVIGRFVAHGWAFEIFGQPLPIAHQHGWRHYLVERRLLALGGEPFHNAIIALRNRGLKTEPAFARLLRLAESDPYAALLDLEEEDDDTLRALIDRAGLFGNAL
jgi:hypothetical protein